MSNGHLIVLVLYGKIQSAVYIKIFRCAPIFIASKNLFPVLANAALVSVESNDNDTSGIIFLF